jgi:hypothetical protein
VSSARDDDFYVGYLPSAPASVARRVRAAVVAILALVAGVALLLVAAQRRLDGRLFEFGRTREFRGELWLDPQPTLAVTRPGEGAGVSRYLLVGPGKHGARELVAGFAGQRVRLRAQLISRGPETALEVEPGSVELEGTGALAPAVTALGTRTLRGEIVDSKCHFGVMNPGEGKSHKDCAIRCISGGAPALLRARDASGETRYFLLAGPDGRALGRELLEFVAEPVEITGSVERHDSVYVLRADPRAIRRLSEGGDVGGAR